MADYKLGFFGEEIDLKLQQIEELRGGVTQLQQNNETITAAIERINTAIEALQNASTGAVRHIQRGFATISKTSDIVIQLDGFTNPDKMIAIVNGNGVGVASSYWVNTMNVVSLTETQLTVRTSHTKLYNTTEFSFSYQVIEFY